MCLNTAVCNLGVSSPITVSGDVVNVVTGVLDDFKVAVSL